MQEIINAISKQATKAATYLTSKDRKHSDGVVGAIALGALSSTAVIAGIAAFKQRPIVAVGTALTGVAGTALYVLQQLYVR